MSMIFGKTDISHRLHAVKHLDNSHVGAWEGKKNAAAAWAADCRVRVIIH